MLRCCARRRDGALERLRGDVIDLPYKPSQHNETTDVFYIKTPACFGIRPSSGSYNVLAKITIIIDHSWMFLC